MPVFSQYMNLSTIYSAKINGKLYRKTRTKDVCFGSSLTKCIRQRNNAEYNIVLITDPRFVNSGNNNYCWMTKHQIENYLRRIKSIKSFAYKVKEDRWNSLTCYNITLNIEGTKKEITFVLQSIKRMYEYPMNYFLFEAYKMQELPAFKFDSILNLFNVVWSSHYGNISNSGHSYSGYSMFKKYKDIAEQLPHVSFVNDIFIKPQGKTPEIIQEIKTKTNSYYRALKDTNDWNDFYFRKFLPTYIKNYNILKS